MVQELGREVLAVGQHQRLAGFGVEDGCGQFEQFLGRDRRRVRAAPVVKQTGSWVSASSTKKVWAILVGASPCHCRSAGASCGLL